MSTRQQLEAEFAKGDGLMTCDAPNPGTEMRCTREANHSGECFSKYKIFYEGIVSWGEMWWCGPNNLPKERWEGHEREM